MSHNDNDNATHSDKSAAGTDAGGPAVRWLAAPEEHDYPAAAAYLSLLAGPDVVEATIAALRTSTVVHGKAKDILRASRLPLLDTDNVHVRADLHKIVKREALSPILAVRGDLTADLPLVVADGYHRVCASYHTDENTDIPLVLAPLPHKA